MSEKAAQAQPATVYVEAHECQKCGHAGINDAHATDAACGLCEWSGPSPVEDKCPGCGEDGTMMSACPKCGSMYRLVAGADIAIEAPHDPAIDAIVGSLGRSRTVEQALDAAEAVIDAKSLPAEEPTELPPLPMADGYFRIIGGESEEVFTAATLRQFGTRCMRLTPRLPVAAAPQPYVPPLAKYPHLATRRDLETEIDALHAAARRARAATPPPAVPPMIHNASSGAPVSHNVAAGAQPLTGWEPIDLGKVRDADSAFWLATKCGQVFFGTYQWKQGRNPDGFETVGAGRISAEDVTHTMLFEAPRHPDLGIGAAPTTNGTAPKGEQA